MSIHRFYSINLREWTGVTKSVSFVHFGGALTVISTILYIIYRFFEYNDNIPTLNRKYSFEPRIFAHLRWTFWSQEILDSAYKKYDGQVYRIARGDVDMVVVPATCITELNKLPQNMINSRLCHAYSMTGHLNGMDVVLKTNLHVKTLLNKITPALPVLLKPAAERIEQAMDHVSSKSTEGWTKIKPVEDVVKIVSRVITLASVGTLICNDPMYIRLTFEHTKLVFTIMFLIRMVLALFQPVFIWLLPTKWQLWNSTKALERFVVPEVNKQKEKQELTPQPDLLSWMIKEAKDDAESNPYMLTNLLAALAAGGTYSSANFIVSVLMDLVGHPHFLKEIRGEISTKHAEVNGDWDFAAFNSLHKLDSAMKESSRLAPGSNTTYSRVMLEDYILSNGVTLKRGQFICVNSHCITKDPANFTDPEQFDALRDYNANFQDHCARPFRDVYAGEYRWGGGRWACAGRDLASLSDSGKVS